MVIIKDKVSSYLGCTSMRRSLALNKESFFNKGCYYRSKGASSTEACHRGAGGTDASRVVDNQSLNRYYYEIYASRREMSIGNYLPLEPGWLISMQLCASRRL